MDNKKNNNKKGLKIFAYSILCLASLTAIALSICNLTGYTTLVGEKGDKGSKGETGDKGLIGDQGTPGEKGEKGETGDKGSIGETGDQGEKGEKGETGDKGSKGDKGSIGPIGDKGSDGLNGTDSDKYYNSIILESKGGHITLDKGCAKVGETVTFTIIPDDNYIFNKLTINDVEVLTNTNYTSGNFEKEYEMVEKGLVVSASFISTTEYRVLNLDNGGELCHSISSLIATDSEGNEYNLKLIGNLTETSTINLSHTLNLDLNGKTLTFDNVKQGFSVNKTDTSGYKLTIKDSSSYKNGKINVVGSDDRGASAINVTANCSLVIEAGEISMTGNNTSNTSNYSYAINAEDNSKIEIFGGKVTSDSKSGHSNTINLSGKATLNINGDVTLTNTKSDTDTSSSVINSTNCDGTKTIKGATFESKAYLANEYGSNLTFEECTFKKEAKFNKGAMNIKDCTFESTIETCVEKAISGTNSKFRNKFETTSWLAEGYSFSDAADSDGYYHLESTTI